MKYYLKLDGKEEGPLTAQEIKARACQSTDLVRREDTSEWVRIIDVKELAAEVPLPPLANPRAKASLVFGLISVALFLFMLCIVNSSLRWIGDLAGLQIVMVYFGSSILAILLGHVAMGKITSSEQPVKGYRMARTGLWLGYFMGIILPVFGSLAAPAPSGPTEKGSITKSINNCKQIILAFKVYASDYNGRYPDSIVPNASSSNEAFRPLFKDEVLNDERIFSSPLSPFIPDNDIGTSPDFSDALKAGENHWAITKGLNESSPGNMPLVFENPSEATWPPKWDASISGKAKPGRTWSGGRVIIGFNDGSVQAMKLESAKGKSVGLKPNAEGKPVFPDVSPKPEILNVAR